MKVSNEKEYLSVFINVQLSKKANELLTKAAGRAGRTKRKEAMLRLEDHLLHFPDIASTGKRFTE